MAKKTSGKKIKSGSSRGPTTFYVRLKAPLTPGGSAPMRERFDFVKSLHDATRFSYDDADYFQKRGSKEQPPISLQMEEVAGKKYIVRGE